MLTVQALPPGPRTTPAEQLAAFQRDPFGCVSEMADRYGELFTLRLASLGNDEFVDVEHNGDWVFLTRPEHLKAMYGADGRTVSGALANQVFFATTEKSVGYIDGKAHRLRRAQLHPAFSGSRDYAEVISRVVDAHVAMWPRGSRFELFPALQALTSEIIVEVVCGGLPAEDKARLRELLPRTENASHDQAQVLQADAAIRAVVAERIPGHLDRLSQDDVLAELLRHAAAGDASLTDEVVRDEVFSLLYTGFSTTANSLSWTLLHVLHEDSVREAILREVGDRFDRRPLTMESFSGLHYVEATITEALRLHPVSALNGVRMVVAPLRLGKYLIPAGTILVHCAYLVQRNEEFYPDPLAFKPERFLSAPANPYTWGAFGGGARTCVGRGYARTEMRMILAMVLASVRMRAVATIPPARQQGIFMAPADGAPCVLEG